ncbi:glycosyltransferase family 2 protein [Williamsia serinedens]|uniref:Glycosyltransferase involved in cell wall bisynthesis n=1 Tax=Williamsia serinedens TaxID=391736 RepID=A0ABT1H3W2_9NOCA|nr:glycosyltransferase family 2 protein [Williamsia serinedens]MCP2161927.1 Glycosyltransferase involved in cell wall bisynthesis [Williamsia serinedens]
MTGHELENGPTVTAIIPTVGRDSLRRAVDSARAQKGVVVRTVVVLDRPEMLTDVGKMVSSEVTVITTVGGVGGAASRNLGLELVQSDYVAYLDDDDVWLPDKLALQIGAMRDSGVRWSLCGANFNRGRTSSVMPYRLPRDTEDILSYALTRTRLRFGESLLQSSCIVVEAKLACLIRWDDNLPRHQDWDLAQRIEAQAGGPVFVAWPLVEIHQQHTAATSISRSGGYEKSINFLIKHAQTTGPIPRADFFWSVMVRQALGAGDFSVFAWRPDGFFRAHIGSVLLGLSGLIFFVFRRITCRVKR